MTSTKTNSIVFVVLFFTLVSIAFSLVFDFFRLNSEFKSDVVLVNRLFTQRVASLETVLTSLSGLHHASDNLNQAELSSFSEQMLKAYPFIHAILGMEKIQFSGIQAFEKRMHQQGFTSLQFKKSNNLESSLLEPFYLPVNFVEPMTPASATLLGLDVRSLPKMSRVIDRAIRSGNVSASSLSTFNDTKKTAVLMFKALYLGRYPPETEAERYTMFSGLVALKINIEHFLDNLMLPQYQLVGGITNVTEPQFSGNEHSVFKFDVLSRSLVFTEKFRMYGQRYRFTLHRLMTVEMINKWQMLAFWLFFMFLLFLITMVVRRRRISEDKIKYLAYYDSLTGLPNREFFKRQVDFALADAVENHSSGAVVFLDLDEFKRINDTLGHDIGDELLIQVSKRLSQQMRQGDPSGSINRAKTKDFVSRLGGDEFTVLLTDIKSPNAVGIVANRILQSINQPFDLNNHEVFVTSSIGIAIFPHDGNDVDQILKHADTAMYHAKDIGKNNYQFYSRQMSTQVERRLKLEGKLRQALENEELRLFYQPQIDTKTNKIVAAEALIRWEQKELGMVFPDEFISVAEETGQIFKIGEWVIEEACRQNKKWQQDGYPPIRVAVNLSGIQFIQENLSEVIASILKKVDLAPEYLELEITESIMMRNMDETISTIHEFTDMNIGVSIDDFGTGYSSLSYLKKFALKSLKVDKSFISDIPEDKDDMMITSAIISMAKSLDLSVVAEGVENQGQVDFLREHDCDLMQGYLFSQPVPVDEFELLLQKQIL